MVTEPVINCKSLWKPKTNHHTIETFVEAVENNVENILQEKKKRLFLTSLKVINLQ